MNSGQEIEGMSEAELRDEIWRCEWNARDWNFGPAPLRAIYARKAEKLRDELARRSQKKTRQN